MTHLIFKRTFRVRHYECDAYGHVNNANYLRYMQEAAMDASAAVGWDERRYLAIGHVWLIRETEIEYLIPLKYGDSVEVSTWVGDFRRVRSRRFYELRRASDGELCARASTDWVYVNRATGQPAPVPAEMIAAFAPFSQTITAAPRAHFPEPPPPPPGTFTMRRRVEWRDIDTAQHVNNAAYFNYIEECGIQAAFAAGWPMQRIIDAHFAIVARKVHIEYKQQAGIGEELDVSTYLSEVRRSTVVRHYRVARAGDGSLIARARTLWVFINTQTGGLARLPESFHADFGASIAEE